MQPLFPTLCESSVASGQVFHSMMLDGVELQGFSRAAIQSYWRFPGWKTSVEAGGCPWEFVRSNSLFVTHTHTDHLQGLFGYVSSRNLLKMKPADIYVPDHCFDSVDDLLKKWSEINNENFAYELHKVSLGQEISCATNISIKPFATNHRLDSCGFLVYETKKKLKKEYIGQSSEEIEKLRQQNIVVSSATKNSKFAFTSDTSIKVFDLQPSLYEVENLVLECTFIDEATKGTACQTGHIHLDELVERAANFKNKRLILCHFSQRYTKEYIAKVCTEKLIPKLQEVELVLWV